MRQIRPALPLLFLALVIFQSCTALLCIFCGQNPVRIKRSCVTAEPGTVIDPKCNLIATLGVDFFTFPDSVYSTKKRIMTLVKPSVRLSADTIVKLSNYDLPMRIYCDAPESKMQELPVIIYYHGGGFIWGSIEVFDGYCRKLAKTTGGIVVAPEYRLAPRFPYPYAINDSYAALKWVSANARALGGDPDRIIVMGGSAGGTIAAVMALKSYDTGGPDIHAQILCYPGTTFEEILYPSRKYFLMSNRSYLLSYEFITKVKKSYLQGDSDYKDPYVSPLLAKLNKDMPPALIITAQADPLRDEGKLYAENLAAAGIEVKYIECEGMIHSFLPFYPILEDSRYILRDISRYIDNLN